MKTLYFKSVDSTNLYLKSNYKALDHMTWLSTDFQSAGKGRSSKSWFGNRDSLMCSVLLKDNLGYDYIQMLPLLAAKSLHQVLSEYHPNILIKWPNDLLVDHLKISGILVESLIENNQILAIIIGFGINMNNQSFDTELKDIATSLLLTTNKSYNKEDLYQRLMKQFQDDYRLFVTNPQFVIDYCNQYTALKDKTIVFTYQNQVVQAKVLSIDHQGHLLVETNNRQMSLYSGEVSILKQKTGQ